MCFTVSGVLENGIEDFHDSEDVYEAIGEVLQEIANKSESDIRYNSLHCPCTLNNDCV